MLLCPNGALLGETDQAAQHDSHKLLHRTTATLSEVRVRAGSLSGACIAKEPPTRLGVKISLAVCVTQARRGQLESE